MTIQSKHELGERLAKATGPDREIDAAIFAAFPDQEQMGDLLVIKRIWPSQDGTVLYTRTDKNGAFFVAGIDRFTSSIDAALALVERERPGWGCLLLSEALTDLFNEHGNYPDIDLIARALLIALIRSLGDTNEQT